MPLSKVNIQFLTPKPLYSASKFNFKGGHKSTKNRLEASERSYELIITCEMVKMPLEVADVNFQTQKHFSDHFHTYLGGVIVLIKHCPRLQNKYGDFADTTKNGLEGAREKSLT